jgi:hypothetical protein
LATGRYPPVSAIRWARIVVGFHPGGSPRFLLPFPVHFERIDTAIDWIYPGSDS